MKNILLLFTKHSADSGQSDPQALCDALAHAAGGTAQYEYAFYDDLLHYINAEDAFICTPGGRRLDTYDAVYQRRWSRMPAHANAVAVYLQKRGIPCIDEESGHAGATDKLVQYWRMWQHGLPFPRTVCIPPHLLPEWLDANLAKEFTLPCIMKSTTSQQGKNNYLVHTVSEAVQIATANPTVQFAVQEYIPNDGDYRVIVCGDAIGLAIYRQRTGDSHTNNTSRGAAASVVPVSSLSAPVRTACIAAARVFGRNFAGVDVVLDKAKPGAFYFFEVNRSPQIDHSTFTAEKAVALHSYLMNLVGEK